MRDVIPMVGLSIQASAATLALSQTAAVLPLTAAVVTIDTGTQDGDVSCRNDKANNRILCSPGAYLVLMELSGTTDGTQDIVVQARKNSVVDPAMLSKKSWTVTIQNNMVCVGVLNILSTDVPGTIPTFPDPTAPTAPAVAFVGGTGAMKNLCPVDFVLTSVAGSPTLTIANARIVLQRVK